MGFLVGVAAAVKRSGCNKTRIYGVKPEGGKTRRRATTHGPFLKLNRILGLCVRVTNPACIKYNSFIEKKPVGMDVNSIASGLAPPFEGTLCPHYFQLLRLKSPQIYYK